MSNAPSAARSRHAEEIEPPRVDDRAFRQGWRVRTRLDTLLASGRIDAAVWQCAVEYRDAWERILASQGGGVGSRVSGATDPHRRFLATIATTSRLRAIETMLGRRMATLCYASVVEDRSWASIGAIWRINPETARDWTVGAVRALAWAWPVAGRDALDASSYPRHAPRRVRPSQRRESG